MVSQSSFVPSKGVLRSLLISQKYNGFFAAFFFVIKSLPVWVLPFFVGVMIDTSIQPTPENKKIGIWCGLILTLLIAQNLLTHSLFSRYLSRGCRSIQLELRSQLIEKIQQLSLSFHESKTTGRLHSKILRDVDQVETLIRVCFNQGLGGICGVVISVGICAFKQPMILLYFLVTIPLIIFLMRFFNSRISHYQHLYRQETENISSSVGEMLTLIPVTKAHGLGEKEVDQMRHRLEHIREKGGQLDRITELFSSSSWVSFSLFQIWTLIFSLWLAWKGVLTPGEVVIFHGYFAMIVNHVNACLGVFPQFSLGRESLDSIYELLDSQEVENNTNKKGLTAIDGSFEFDQVYFEYPGQTKYPSLRAFSLSIPSGQCVAVIGASGAGKTTLMNLIVGFIHPTSGKIRIDGEDLSTLDLKSYRQFISVIPQQTVLFSGTIRDNITYGLDRINESELNQVLFKSRVSDFLPKLTEGIHTLVGERGAKLSGGQRQRIAIARAMIRNPRILIMDEATSALDSETEQKIQEAMKELVKGRTTFIVAHRLSTIREVDQIIVLHEGQIVEVGTPEVLLQKEEGWYRKLLEIQS